MEADNGKQYSLRWEKHAYNLASEAGCFFEDESFLDCTLSAEGQCIEAHKIILSAASSYLSNLLKIMPDKHPILIFNDIKFEQLKSLVAFIYNGSVNVSESNIHAFLNAAQSLLIKGLSEESKDEERAADSIKRPIRTVEVQDLKTNCKKNTPKILIPKKPEFASDPGKSFVKQKQMLSRSDGTSFVECEESLSKLQEISITKYTQQNHNSKLPVRNEILENKWNGPVDEKIKSPENYVVKSWKHNSVEDLNGRLKQNKGNAVKRIRLEKSTNSRSEEPKQGDKKKVPSEHAEVASGNYINRNKPEDTEEKIKKELETEQITIVEPKQEIIEEEDTNSEEYNLHNSNSDIINPDAESVYENRPMSNYHQKSLVDRGIPVPLLMCRTSLSEPDSVEPNWVPPVAGNYMSDHLPLINSVDSNAQDLQCRTCAQDLPCPTCTKKYKSRYALNRHILYECGKARKSFSCDECGKKVTRQDTLQKHKLIHLVQHLKKKESERDQEPSKPKKIF